MGGIVINNLFFNLPGRVSKYDNQMESFSPMLSTIGLCVSDKSTGVNSLFLHYNRFTRPIWTEFFDCGLSYSPELSSSSVLHFGDADTNLRLSFYDVNSFVIQSHGLASITLLNKASDSLRDMYYDYENDAVIVCGHSENGDERDPDETVYFELGIKAGKGIIEQNENHLTVVSCESGDIFLSFCCRVLDVVRSDIVKILNSSPEDVSQAEKINQDFINFCLRDFKIGIQDEHTGEMVAKALQGLIFNLSKGEGRLNKHLSFYPNRGTYPTHFLWDTCFENLAFELMNTDIAQDLLIQFAETQRPDGKYEQFICSTWGRPHDTQPALIGWATLRLYKLTGDKSFIERMLPSIELNNRWWLTSRMTKYGLVFCPGGLETGQDDSPRFDNGPTLAVDMNSYLLHQINCCLEIRRELGMDTSYWSAISSKLSNKISGLLHDHETDLYYDFCLKTESLVKIISPSSLLPLWAGVTDNDPCEMIKRYLINPEYMFGDVPFPSVAYNEKEYNSSLWWRGPTWLPIARLMLETLERYGFENERRAAAKRLLAMIIKDGRMSELFDSESGEGLGAAEQGWTCAVFLSLLEEFCE